MIIKELYHPATFTLTYVWLVARGVELAHLRDAGLEA